MTVTAPPEAETGTGPSRADRARAGARELARRGGTAR